MVFLSMTLVTLSLSILTNPTNSLFSPGICKVSLKKPFSFKNFTGMQIYSLASSMPALESIFHLILLANSSAYDNAALLTLL